ncbi:hypothetical protein F511_32512 [Dorcoceras hygrometricum]|uniref:Uncharacterized protein n=1 Tax=Dorcoceras hygrometricum TaxID=472368 RepID=A0A2Z7BCQ4_9LAMI|nr:hypothetical protein F511_32512 [Dorcoceras hygrometricum]
MRRQRTTPRATARLSGVKLAQSVCTSASLHRAMMRSNQRPSPGSASPVAEHGSTLPAPASRNNLRALTCSSGRPLAQPFACGRSHAHRIAAQSCTRQRPSMAQQFAQGCWPIGQPSRDRARVHARGGITDSACKNQLVVVSVQYGPFNPYIPIRSTTIGKSRVAKDPIAMHKSWRSNSDITSVTSIGYPRMSASGESSTTMHRLLHASGSHPIPSPDDPNIGYPRTKASGESSTTKHRLLHASGSHPIPPPDDPN